MSNEYIETKYTREDIFNNLKYGTNIRRAICETLRQIYDYVYEMPESELKKKYWGRARPRKDCPPKYEHA